MLLYQFRMGTNPRRVIIYLAEKGLDVPRYELDYVNGEHRSPEYWKITLPAGHRPWSSKTVWRSRTRRRSWSIWRSDIPNAR